MSPLPPALPKLPPTRPKTRTPVAPAPTQKVHIPKRFSISAWDGAGEGQKIILYGASGRGKTTLASMAPRPIFIGLDDGGRMVRNPLTNEPVRRVAGVETYQDVRDALRQFDLYTDYESVVIDTGTALELLAIQHVIATVPHEKSSIKIEHIEDYGYGKGYNHLFDAMRLIFQDLDTLVRRGKNVIVLCQQCPVVVANAAGANYLQDGPKLYAPGPESKQSFAVRGYACEWADHVCRIDFLNQQVVGSRIDTTGKEHAGKIKGTDQRAVFVMQSDPSFFAKTRTLREPVIAFENQADDSLWQMIFNPEEGEN